MSFRSLLALLVLSGCSADFDRPVRVDETQSLQAKDVPIVVFFDASFTLEETMGLTSALSDWQEAGVRFRLEAVNHDVALEESGRSHDVMADTRFYFVRVRSIQDPECVIGDGAARTWTTGKGAVLCFSASVRMPEAYWRAMGAHELGHALGLSHREFGIMRPDVDEKNRVECGDLADVAKVRGLLVPDCA